MLRIEAAHSRSLGNELAARGIEAAQICPEDLTEGTAVDGLPVPELVHCLKAQISPELHGDIYRGLTSQDVMDTAFVHFDGYFNDLRAGIDCFARGSGAVDTSAWRCCHDGAHSHAGHASDHSCRPHCHVANPVRTPSRSAR